MGSNVHPVLKYLMQKVKGCLLKKNLRPSYVLEIKTLGISPVVQYLRKNLTVNNYRGGQFNLEY